MRIYTNAKHIEKRAKLGRRTSLAGLTILAVGMAASFAPGVISGWVANENPLADNAIVQWLMNGGWLYVSMICLLGGFLLGQVGNANMRRFQQSPRPDEVVAAALKGFDDRNHLYAWSEPADLVFAGPAGIFTIVTRGQAGEISIEGGRIKQPFNIRRLLFAFGQEPAGLPVDEAQKDAGKLSAWLDQTLETTDPVAVNPVVVFTNDNAKLDIQDSSAPIVHHKQLKQYLRGQLRGGSSMSRATMSGAIDALDTEAERRGAEIE
ncbi:MAG: hypothetical protein GY759_08650 [Chloroflexi bacterium]|nr:hypothetical protein [Chloroflexota bacterium]